jgi:RND family efflux transporter MFP subunit
MALRHGLVLAMAAVFAVLQAGPVRAQSGAPVSVATAELRSIVNRVRVSGSVVAPRTSRVSTSLGGLVERVPVQLGAEVEAGAALVELDADLARLELQRARAAVAEAEARLADARRRVRVAERLSQRNTIPQNELDSRRAAVREAEAAVRRLQAEAASARTRLERHRIDAPFAGTVTAREAEAGEWVRPGDTLVELVATDELYVDLQVPQAHFPDVQSGPPMTLRFEALPDRDVDGVVASIVPVSDPTARTFTLRVLPQADAPLPLTPGMSARASLRLATGGDGVTIPRGAVIRYPDGRTTVWAVADGEEGPVARERQVTLGRSFDGVVHVRDGLSAGTRVVVRGNETLSPGQPIRITDSGS